jgi:ferric-dicitrate binding protein FerR (iron transport regulator)
MNDELLGRYYGKQPRKDNEVDPEIKEADIKSIREIQKVVDQIELLKRMKSIKSKQALSSVKNRLEKRKSTNWRIILQRAAVILLLPMLAFSIWQSHIIKNFRQSVAMAEISTPPTLRSSFTLPDGTTVWLNGGSTIKYPTQFTGKQRLVELNGEAYFKVAHNERKPFLVKTGNLFVQALGTEFNSCAYDNESKIETVLTEGRVAILSDNARRRKRLMTLEPGQMAVFNKETRQLAQKVVAVDKYTAWREGKIIFKNDSMSEVILRLERWYNVEFIADENLNSNYAFTGSFQGEELTQILNYIELTTPVHFEILKPEKDEEQLYLKTKIRIKAKK